MLKIYLWLRYIRNRRIVFLSVISVALCVSLLVVVSSLFSGFIDAFENSAKEVLGDVILEPAVKFSNYQELIDQLESTDSVDAATATLSGYGMLFLGKGDVRAVQILGIDPVSRSKVTGFSDYLLCQKGTASPSFDLTGFQGELTGFVSVGALAQPDPKSDQYDFETIKKEMVGKKVVITTGGQNDKKPEKIIFRISDIVFTGVYELDKNFVYLPIDALRKKIYPSFGTSVANQIQIRLKENADESTALDQIRNTWRSFAAEKLNWGKYLTSQTKIVTSTQMQAEYVLELRKQMSVLLFIFGIVSLSCVILIFCILYMIVETRQRDIAIIKSCGSSFCQVGSVFLGFGLFIGAIGSLLGLCFGYFITKNINFVERIIGSVLGIKLWKSSVYMFSQIPNQVDWPAAIKIVLFALLACGLGALIPAIVAIRANPVAILRYE